MKKIIVLMLIAQSAFSQTIPPPLPIKDGKLFYELIDSSVVGSQKELHNKVLLWLANIFPNSKSVIQLNDSTTGEIIGKATIQLQVQDIALTLHFSCRENKYRVQVYDFKPTINGSSWEPIEAAMKSNGKRTKNFVNTFDLIIRGMMTDIKEKMHVNNKDF